MWQLLRDAGCIEHYSGERALQWLVGKKVAVDLSIVCWHHPLFLKFTYIITYPILLILCVISIVPLNWPPKDRRSQELHAHLVPKVWVYNIYYFTNSFILFFDLSFPLKHHPSAFAIHTRANARTRTRARARTHGRTSARTYQVLAEILFSNQVEMRTEGNARKVVFERLVQLCRLGASPILCADGCPPKEKAQTLRDRFERRNGYAGGGGNAGGSEWRHTLAFTSWEYADEGPPPFLPTLPAWWGMSC